MYETQDEDNAGAGLTSPTASEGVYKDTVDLGVGTAVGLSWQLKELVVDGKAVQWVRLSMPTLSLLPVYRLLLLEGLTLIALLSRATSPAGLPGEVLLPLRVGEYKTWNATLKNVVLALVKREDVEAYTAILSQELA